MIECTNGGPWDGDYINLDYGDEQEVPVKSQVSISTLINDGARTLVHVYRRRQGLERDVYEYMGEAWR